MEAETREEYSLANLRKLEFLFEEYRIAVAEKYICMEHFNSLMKEFQLQKRKASKKGKVGFLEQLLSLGRGWGRAHNDNLRLSSAPTTVTQAQQTTRSKKKLEAYSVYLESFSKDSPLGGEKQQQSSNINQILRQQLLRVYGEVLLHFGSSYLTKNAMQYHDRLLKKMIKEGKVDFDLPRLVGAISKSQSESKFAASPSLNINNINPPELQKLPFNESSTGGLSTTYTGGSIGDGTGGTSSSGSGDGTSSRPDDSNSSSDLMVGWRNDGGSSLGRIGGIGQREWWFLPRPDAWVFKIAMQNFSHMGQLEKMDQCYLLMQELSCKVGWEDCKPNIFTANAMIAAWARYGMIEKMENFYNDVLKSTKNSTLKPDMDTFGRLIHKFLLLASGVPPATSV